MKHIILSFVIMLVAMPFCFAQSKAGKTDTTKHVTYYACPHHPDMVSKEPGKCEKCGMDLVLSNKQQMKAKVTKSYSCPVHTDVVSHDPGKCPQCGKKLHLSAKEQMKAEIGKVYTCPMHPQVALDKEGKCPKCGTALVEKKN
jgi:transcription initiation factor IIE alpha subunit